ncbi:MAG: hypothetical protein Q4A00_04075 [Flavobacteriaceae bacterium]|nr:hypothetical protein [Flavobacteriaceae bacterium]
MKVFKSYAFFVLFLFSFFKAQYTVHPMLSTGYSYQNQSFVEIGGKILFLKKDEVAYRIGASTMLGSVNQKFAIIPKIQGDILFNFRKNADIHHGFYYIAGIQSTTKYFAPYLGMNILGMIDFTGGYSWTYPNQTLNGKELKGLNFGINLNIPLVIFE